MEQTTAIQTPEQKAQRKQAEAALEKLRGKINEFHSLRLVTSELRAGMRQAVDPRTKQPLNAEEVDRRVKLGRDQEAEVRAVGELRDFLRLTMNREPTPQEMQASSESIGALGLGFWLPLIALATVTGGAMSLDTIFDYLSQRERRVQQELGYVQPPTAAETFASTVRWAVPAVVVVGAGIGGYYFWQKRKKYKKNPTVPDAPEEDEAGNGPSN